MSYSVMVALLLAMLVLNPDEHGDKIDGCHGIGLCLKERCFQGSSHAAHAQLPQGRDQVRSDS